MIRIRRIKAKIQSTSCDRMLQSVYDLWTGSDET